MSWAVYNSTSASPIGTRPIGSIDYGRGIQIGYTLCKLGAGLEVYCALGQPDVVEPDVDT